jgi:diguanylate cyclase (GGDEF)-like protein
VRRKLPGSLRAKTLALAAIPLVALAIAVVLAVGAQEETARTSADVDRSTSVRHRLSETQESLAEAEAGVRGYLLTGRESFLEQYDRGVGDLPAHLAALHAEVKDRVQARRLDRLDELVAERVQTLQAVRLFGAVRTPEQQARLETWLLHGRTISDGVRGLIDQMEITEGTLMVDDISARDAAFRRSYVVDVIVMPVALLTATLMLIGFIGSIVRRIGVIRNNARRLEQGNPLHEPDASDDELGSLSRALVRTGSHLFELQEELRQLATEDPLTGLANRRGFEPLAQHELLVAARTRRAIALLFIDIDGLKQVNDELGHSMGDAMIVETADLIRETIRTSDLAARIGGDEFCVLLAGDPDLDADRVVQRIRDAESAHNARLARSYRLSLSIGVSDPERGRPLTLEELIDAADELMYADKRDRRNGQTAHA